MNKDFLNPDQKSDRYFGNPRNDMLPFVPVGINKVLEVGCNTGSFGVGLKSERNVEVWGIEICENAAKIARDMLDNVILGDIEQEEIFLPQNYFDCIIFNDVLEHLYHPWNVLRKLKENLKQDGYVVASIPNLRYHYTIYDLLRYKKWMYIRLFDWFDYVHNRLLVYVLKKGFSVKKNEERKNG